MYVGGKQRAPYSITRSLAATLYYIFIHYFLMIFLGCKLCMMLVVRIVWRSSLECLAALPAAAAEFYL